MRKFNKTLLAMTTLLAASGANAAAFQLAEVSTSGLGRAYAGEAAIADNASVVPVRFIHAGNNNTTAGGSMDKLIVADINTDMASR